MDEQQPLPREVRHIEGWDRWWLRAEPWPLLLVALALMFAYFWWYSYPAVAMVGLSYCFDFCLGSFLFAMLAAARRVQLAVRRSYETHFGLPPGALQSRRRFWPWLLAIAAGTFIMVASQFPLHASFLISRPALDGIADQALADPVGAPALAGCWAGLYTIRGVEVIGSTVVLYVGKDKGNYGFARVPGAPSDVIFNMPGLEDRPMYHRDFPKHDAGNDPVGRRISGGWFVMYSGYWRVKVGWS